jgi:hypothetical protein
LSPQNLEVRRRRVPLGDRDICRGIILRERPESFLALDKHTPTVILHALGQRRRVELLTIVRIHEFLCIFTEPREIKRFHIPTLEALCTVTCVSLATLSAAMYEIGRAWVADAVAMTLRQ